MAEQSKTKRVTLKRSRPNPVFEDWLQNMYEEALATNSHLLPKLQLALESIRKYPLPLKSAAECAVLKGFDSKLCNFMDRRITANFSSVNSEVPTAVAENGDKQSSIGSPASTNGVDNNMPINGRSGSTNGLISNVSSNGRSTDESEPPKKKSKRPRVYKPVYRSGGYAILVALLTQPEVALGKQELITLAQPHSEESFTRPKPESYYTAWSSMKTLISKGLVVCTRSKKVVYSLSDEGIALAMQLLEDYKDKPTMNDVIFHGASSSEMSSQDTPSISASSSQIITPVLSQISSSEEMFIELPEGSFDVVLLIDKQETSGASNKNDPTVAQFKKYPDLKHEYRSLKVGDFTWIAQHKINKDQELVLPYIVERKRMDDFGKSIKDGRFHEQKFRLRKCGLKNVIYLVEHFGSNKHVGLPMQSLMQAMANTRIQDDFKVHVTDSLNNSARFLAMMTKRLTVEYKDQFLIGTNRDVEGAELMTFKYFNKMSTKNKPLTVTEMFIKLLLQLKGMSVEKALAITKIYSTPKSLIKEYAKCTQKEGEQLLATIKYGTLNRNVGPAVSRSIYRFLVWKT